MTTPYNSADDILDAYGIADGRHSKPAPREQSMRAANATDKDAWIPVTNLSRVKGTVPNFTMSAWLEFEDSPGNYQIVPTQFRTHDNFIEVAVPANTVYIIGVGTPPF